MKETLLSFLNPNCPFRGSLHCYASLDSTNTHAKELARQGAPHGTVVIARSQTQGRGRMGRSFVSPESGVYLSLILRPDCDPGELMHLTCAAAVAACDAVEAAAGIRPGIKWINDLVYEGKKLGGILTELSVNPQTRRVEFAVIGIGINCQTVPQPVAQLATSLHQATGKLISPLLVCARLIEAFSSLELSRKTALMHRYRTDCLTLGRQVRIAGTELWATALDVTDDGFLVLQFPDGSRRTVSSGEVSVRGMYDYV